MIVRQKLRYVAGRYLILTTYDTRSNAVLKLLSPFVLKKIKDFCLLNLIKHIKYNLCLSFIHRIGPFKSGMCFELPGSILL